MTDYHKGYQDGFKDGKEEYKRKINKAIETIEDFNINEVMDGCSEFYKRGAARGLDMAAVIIKKNIGGNDELH